jgi:DnaJ-class molecular chaperone
METVVCNACKTNFQAETDVSVDARKPCPSCGSTARLFSQTIEVNVTPQVTLNYKGKRGGKGKPFIIGKLGADLFVKLQRWVHLERIIDRENDRYKEVVTDPTTKEIIHRCEEPLSQHQNHGAAKKPR